VEEEGDGDGLETRRDASRYVFFFSIFFTLLIFILELTRLRMKTTYRDGREEDGDGLETRRDVSRYVFSFPFFYSTNIYFRIDFAYE
jgi:hypothetical protein